MIQCTIKDADGNELGTFQPKGEKNLVDEASDAGIEIPFSCHAGACMSCAGRVVQGAELMDQEKDGPKYMETDDDVYLLCIGGVYADPANDGDEHELEIELLG